MLCQKKNKQTNTQKKNNNKKKPVRTLLGDTQSSSYINYFEEIKHFFNTINFQQC